MDIAPLPIRTRVVTGETLDLYAKRHAARNFTTVADIEHALRTYGQLPSSTIRLQPERIEAWRKLGALSPRAFRWMLDEPTGRVVQRRLCERCTPGQRAVGYLPSVGRVCIRHRRWIGNAQADVSAYPRVITAERHFRLSTRSLFVTFNGPLMTTALDAATVAIPDREVEDRIQKHGLPDRSIAIYPEQVVLATLLTRWHILRILTDEYQLRSQRLGLIADAVADVLQCVPNANSRAAASIMWTVAARIEGQATRVRLFDDERVLDEFSLVDHAMKRPHDPDQDDGWPSDPDVEDYFARQNLKTRSSRQRRATRTSRPRRE